MDALDGHRSYWTRAHVYGELAKQMADPTPDGTVALIDWRALWADGVSAVRSDRRGQFVESCHDT